MPSQAQAIREIVAANIDRGIKRHPKMTNRAVGDQIGSTEHQVWRWRTGKHMPSKDNLIALANVLFDGDITQLYAPTTNGRTKDPVA